MTAIAPKPEATPTGEIRDGSYSDEDWEEVSDTPELTDAEIAQLRPARELPADILAALPRRKGRPKAAEPKVPVTIRLDREIVERFRASGPGWQSRINAILRKARA